MRSSAFDMIDDPNDPAWAGHAPDPDTGRGRRYAIAAVLAVVLVAAGGFLATRGSSSDARATSASAKDAASGNVLPSAIVPDPDAAIAPVDADATAGSGASAAGGDGAAGATGDAAGGAAPTSGWAPAQATVPHWDSRWLEGDLVGIAPVVADRLEVVARALDTRIEVISGWRTTHEQNSLYKAYLSGQGNLAAPPGLSKHESGMAADAYIDGVALASVDGAVEAARAAGLHFPVGGEPWHVELID